MTSDQSSRTGKATVAPFGGLESDGAAGVAGAGGVTVSVALRETPDVPVIDTAVEAVTLLVATVKVALVLPAGTVTLEGTVATAVLLLESDTTRPPDGAALVSVARPCDDVPPDTVAGVSEIDEMWDILQRQISQLTRLVDDLLDVSRISAGRIAKISARRAGPSCHDRPGLRTALAGPADE